MGLALPGTTWSPLGPQTEPKMLSHDIICLHTMVGSLKGTDSYFRQNGYGGTESHFGMGGNGHTIQWQDLAYQADANNEGNDRVISIETADKGETFPVWTGSNVPPWTDAQVNKIIDMLDDMCRPAFHANCPATWDCHKVGIPRVLVPDTKPARRGIGYHRQGVDPWRVEGGESWSLAYGKVCPGDKRINQLTAVILPAVLKLGQPVTPPVVQPPPKPTVPGKDDEMFTLFYDQQAKQYYFMTPWFAGKLTPSEGYNIDLNSPGLVAVLVPTTAAMAKILKKAPVT